MHLSHEMCAFARLLRVAYKTQNMRINMMHAPMRSKSGANAHTTRTHKQRVYLCAVFVCEHAHRAGTGTVGKSHARRA